MSKSDETIDALLPAGGRVSGEFAQMAGAEIKALIRFDGVSILKRTIAALKATDRIGRIVVVGPPETHVEALECGATATLNEADTGSANILCGLQWLHSQKDPADRVLVVTTDMPFLTSAAICGFLSACPADKDICIPVVERTPFERCYPDLIRTDSHLADGWFRLGGLFLVDPTTVLSNRAYLEQVFAARKSNMKMAKLAGIGFILRYVTRRLSTEDIVKRAGEILHCSGAVVKDVTPEIGFDIDLPEEYVYAVKQVIEGKG